MHRVKYESTTTGTGALTLTVPTGFQALSAAPTTYPVSGGCMYTILDGNGVGWEIGYGSISGSTLTRQGLCFNSSEGASGPGSYYPVDLSATTPHTILINRGFFEGHRVLKAYQNTTGTAFSTAESTTLGSLSTLIDGLTYALDNTGGSSATVVADPMTELPFAKSYRITFVAECDDTSAGNFFGAGIRINSATKDLVAAYAPLKGTDTIVSVTTPTIRSVPPFYSSTTTHCLNDGGVVSYVMYNTSGGSITVKPTIYIEWDL